MTASTFVNVSELKSVLSCLTVCVYHYCSLVFKVFMYKYKQGCWVLTTGNALPCVVVKAITINIKSSYSAFLLGICHIGGAALLLVLFQYYT